MSTLGYAQEEICHMATFVHLEAPTGDARWVNPDHVQFLAAADDGLCSLHLFHEDEFSVRGTPEEVVAKLEGRSAADTPAMPTLT
jgi:hypothetical protein